MVETSTNLNPAKENLLVGLATVEQKYPKIVKAIAKILSQPVPKEKPIKIKGKIVDHYTEYTPSMNSFYQEGVSETDRVANLLFWSNRILKPVRLSGIKSRLKSFLNREKIAKDEELSGRIDEWIKSRYGAKSTEFDRFGVYITNLVLAEGLSFHGVSSDEAHNFNSDLAKMVFGSLENGLAPEEVLSLLKKNDFLIPYVGIDSPVTWEDLEEK